MNRESGSPSMKPFLDPEIKEGKHRVYKPPKDLSAEDTETFSEHESGYPSSDEEVKSEEAFKDDEESLDEELEGFTSPFKSIIG